MASSKAFSPACLRSFDVMVSTHAEREGEADTERHTNIDGQTHTHLLNVIGCGDERAQSFAALGHPRQLLGPLVTTGGVWGGG